jgi:hypothetical protein
MVKVLWNGENFGLLFEAGREEADAGLDILGICQSEYVGI